MLEKIIDLHIHSKYSRACSPSLELPKIAEFCAIKGVDIVATGDFTHPQWFKHIEESLEEIEDTGLYRLKNNGQHPPTPLKGGIKFILSTEVSCIYKHKDKVRRLHLLVLAPNLAVVKKFNEELEGRGVNTRSDGRPIMGLSAKEIVKICLSIDSQMMVIPAHAWTPWFAVFGSKSGYDSLEECFEELAPNIRAIETGLSSDPPMNHRLSQLDNITLVSNSDAHSPDNIGREANVLAFNNEEEVTYSEIKRIIEAGDKNKFLYTIEFYPEEGMYHFDGHRDCNVSMSPAETKKAKYLCPVCNKKLTVGVLHRVDDLADRSENKIPKNFIAHKYIVPLKNLIGLVFGVGKQSKKVANEYNNLIKHLGNEFGILLHKDIKEIAKVAIDPGIAETIQNMRDGKVKLIPGYDGVYGKVEALAIKNKPKYKQKSLI